MTDGIGWRYRCSLCDELVKPGHAMTAHLLDHKESDLWPGHMSWTRVDEPVNEDDYQYRVVLREPDGRVVPLVPIGGLAITRERLSDILTDDTATIQYEGWVERRKPGEWERFE